MLLGIGLAGCRGDVASTEQAARGSEAGFDCLDFEGHLHCPLGAAKLNAGSEGLRAEELRSSEDGVAILLPEVAEFATDGSVEGDGSVLHARSINEGVSTSTMTVQKSDKGYLVSATFTGSGDASTYHANLYHRGELVGTLRNLTPDIPFPLAYHLCHPGHPNWPNCWPTTPPHFRVVQRRTSPPADLAHAALPTTGEPGACVWSMPIDDMRATLEDGSEVLTDLVELVEVVPAAGSYAYFTFNRIDYTTDGGSLLLKNERVK